MELVFIFKRNILKYIGVYNRTNKHQKWEVEVLAGFSAQKVGGISISHRFHACQPLFLHLLAQILQVKCD
jgi:hypothetical protein